MSQALTREDREMFLRLSIPETIIERARIVRVDTAQAYEEFGVNLDGDSGIAFPYFAAPNGTSAHRLTARIRRDHPPADAKGKVERKYLSPRNDVRHLYFAPCEPGWIEDPQTPVIFLESEKAALSILSWCERHDRRFICVALGGCWNWRGRIGKILTADGERVDETGPLPDLRIAQNRKVYILFDADVVKNNKVYVAREKFVEALQALQADVHILNLPVALNVNGPDDYLGAYGDAAFFTLFETVEHRTASGQKSQTGERIMTDTFADIESKPTKWLWPDRIPAGYISVFSGDPDCGKTTTAVDIVARYTTGRDWPDGTTNTVPPGSVLMLIAEDGAEDVIKPRLVAADADLSRVHFLTCIRTGPDSKKADRVLALDHDLQLLEERLNEPPQFGLVVIDPVTSYFGRADMYKEQEVRRVLGPIKEVCSRTGCTFLALGHFNKRSDVSALHRVGGAVANTGVPRAVWMFMKDSTGDKGDMLMLLGKGNFTGRRTGMRYRFAAREVLCDTGERTMAPVIDWQGEEADSTADSVLATAHNPEEKASARAEKFLRTFLVDDEKPSAEILTAADRAGIKRRTLFTVKKELGIRAVQHAGSWWWQPIAPQESECKQ
jgi:putative DNA primase/helicase